MFLTAVLIYTMQQLSFPLPAVINNYVNDLLCLPLLLGAMEFIIKWLKKDKFFKFPISFVILLASYYSIYFEYYLPKVNPRYTADWIDVILYFLGGLIFYFFGKKNNGRVLKD
jgi:hypothetical protein